MADLMRIDISKGWLPDFPPHEMPEGGCVQCKNLIPQSEYYSPAYNVKTIPSTTLAGVPLRGRLFTDLNGISKTYIGTSSRLYELYGEALTDKTHVSGYASSVVTPWDFEIYGNWVIATNYVNPPQVLKGFSESRFTNLSGSPPKAKYVMHNNGHLIFANTENSPKELVWSAYRDVEDYSPSLTTGAGSTVLDDADGEITGIAEVGNLLAVFHPASITLMYYVGFPYTFQFVTKKVRQVGGIPGTMISIGNVCYFWDWRDIYIFDGNSQTPIGFGVRRTVLNELDQNYIHRITTLYDTSNRVIYWAYPTIKSSDGTPDKILVYNTEAKRFTWLDMSVDCLFEVILGAVDMDSLDNVYSDIDLMPYHIDSQAYKGSVRAIACAKDNEVATLTGAILTGELETREISSGDSVLYVNRVRPNIYTSATNSVRVKVGSRMSKSDVPSYTDEVIMNSEDNCDIRKTGRLLRFNVQTVAHSGFTSIDADIKPISER